MSSNPVSPSPDSLGLSVDMLDVDRLRQWAANIEQHGPDVTHWGSTHFMVQWLRQFATNVEQAIRDIGVLRANRGEAVSPPTDRWAQVIGRLSDYLAAGGLWNPELANHNAVSLLIRETRDAIDAARAADAAAHAEEIQRLRADAHELALIVAAVGDRGVTDCSTPTFIRVQNIIERMEAAEVEIVRLSAQLQEKEQALLEARGRVTR